MEVIVLEALLTDTGLQVILHIKVNSNWFNEFFNYFRKYPLILYIYGIDRKKNHYTHARGKLLGVHIGVYQPFPDLKRTLVAISERTGMSVSQVTDEVLYAGLVEMQELPAL